MNQQSKILPLYPKLKMSPLLGDIGLNFRNPKWEEADFRLCLTFNGDFFVKQTSATITQITALVRQAERMAGIKIYLDFSFQLDPDEIALLRQQGLKEIFGWCSYRTLDEFDVLMNTFSIHFEMLSFTHTLWGAGLKAFYNERKDDPNSPLMIGGGIISTMFEPLYGADEGPMLDLAYLGEGEDFLPQVILSCYNHRELRKTDREGYIRKICEEQPCLYFPAGYKHHYGLLPEDQLGDPRSLYDCRLLEYYGKWKDKPANKEIVLTNYDLTRIEATRDWVPMTVHHHRSFNKKPPMFEERVSMVTNDGASRGELQISHGCMGYGACYFCSEGTEAGTWREYDEAKIVENMEVLKRHCAPNVISFFSFNTNFYSTIFDLYYEVAKRFSYVSVIAFRADVVSAVPDYIRFLKALGTFRITVAVEGISERIREAFLNKNLTWDQILKTAEYVFREKFVMMKFNLIFTGHETEADFAEFNSICERMVKMRNDLGAKTSLVWSATTLVTYNNVGLMWQPRLATICEVFEERRFKGIVQHGRTLGIRFRFNSGPEFILQQMLVDAGRRMTKAALPIYRKWWEENLNMNNGTMFKAVNKAVFQDLGLNDSNGEPSKEAILGFWGRKRQFDELNPTSSIEVLPPFVKKMLFHAAGKKETRYCLANAANPTPKCRVCGFCDDRNFSQPNIIQRNYKSRRGISDVESAIFLNKAKSTLRIVYRTNDDPVSRYRFKIVQNHLVAARINQWNAQLCTDFHSCGNYSDYVPTFHSQPDSWGGVGHFDINFRTSLEDLRAIFVDPRLAIGQINQLLECQRVVAIHVLPYVPNSQKKTKGLWQFTTSIPRAELNERFMSYSGKIKIIDKGAGPEPEVLEEHYSRDQFSLFMIQQPSQTTGFFTLGGRYNAFMALWSFFGYKPNLVKEHFRIDRLGSWDMVNLPCPASPHENGVDIILNAPSKVCPDCVCKVRALKLQKDVQEAQQLASKQA